MKRVNWHQKAARSAPGAVGAMIAAALLFGATTPASAQTDATPPPTAASTPATAAAHATYIGTEACAACHDQAKDWANNPHHNAVVDGQENGPNVTCESCHGPGSLHAAAEGDEENPGFHTIRNLKKMTPAASSDICVSCHRTSEQFHWQESTHARNDIACINCHSMHSPLDPGGQKLLSAPNATAQCVKCHHDKRAELAHTAHMPLREGQMTCADCHNPHGSPGPHMIRGASNNELCESCHMDKRGPMLWEHPPVRENCVTCHMPHGSNNDKVLASKKPFLCQRCHIATRHPSTLYDQPDLVSNRLFNRSCTNCHSQIHGSNHPSGETFLR
jgi:DmsE family decaheme c-type cytochrome